MFLEKVNNEKFHLFFIIHLKDYFSNASAPYTGCRDPFKQICQLICLLDPNGETVNTGMAQ